MSRDSWVSATFSKAACARPGNRVRINAQLIDGSTGDHVWAERYDRDLTDIFAIQDEISKAIVEALKVKLLPEEKEAIEDRGTNERRCLQPLPHGAAIWIDGDFGDPVASDRDPHLRRATEIDPEYAQAWALMGLAQANLRYAYTGHEDADDGLAAANRRWAQSHDR